MPKTTPPPTVTKVQRAADTLIAGAPLTDVKQLRAAVSAIKRVYYAALGNARRRALRTKLDEHYASLVTLARNSNKTIAAAALRALPPVLRPKPAKAKAKAKAKH
ncbi:MAG: hypothetical protein ACKV2T_42815 [Kofleriaceae bacterium]